jgi:hypothetical protein
MTNFKCRNLDDLLLGPNKLGTNLSTTHLTQLVTDVDTLFERLAHGKSTDETTSKHVSGTVGVNDLVVCELGDGEGLGVRVSGLDVGDSGGWAGRGNEGRVGTLGDDDETGSGRVGFGVVG